MSHDRERRIGNRPLASKPAPPRPATRPCGRGLVRRKLRMGPATGLVQARPSPSYVRCGVGSDVPGRGADPTRNSVAPLGSQFLTGATAALRLETLLVAVLSGAACRAHTTATEVVGGLGLVLWNLRVRLWNKAGGAGGRSPEVLRKLDHLKGVPTCHVARSHRVTLDHPCVPTVSETRGTHARCHFSIWILECHRE